MTETQRFVKSGKLPLLLVLLCTLFSFHPGFGQSMGYLQQGNRLISPDAPELYNHGSSIAISEDGNTAIAGSSQEDAMMGGARIFVRSTTGWTQQAELLGTGNEGRAEQGTRVAISADGNTAVISGPQDASGAGAIWTFVRSGTTWTQLGNKLQSPGGTFNGFGNAIALSGDGNTLVAGAASGDGAWVYTRSGNTWVQQGGQLQGTGRVGSNEAPVLDISGDGNTILLGFLKDNQHKGAVWVFTRSGTTWTQQGNKLTDLYSSAGSGFGTAVSVSGDGNMIVITARGGSGHPSLVHTYVRQAGDWIWQTTPLLSTHLYHEFAGCIDLSADASTLIVSASGQYQAITFVNTNSSWVMQGELQTSTCYSTPTAVCLSRDGNTALLGATCPDNNASLPRSSFAYKGNVHAFTRSVGAWAMQQELVPLNVRGNGLQGTAVDISADGNTMIVSGGISRLSPGRTWIYIRSGNTWMQQAVLPVGGNTTYFNIKNVALSADGNTAIIVRANFGIYGVAATYIYTRSAGVWTQQAVLPNLPWAVSADITADGNTVIVGEHEFLGNEGAVTIFSRSGNAWTRQMYIQSSPFLLRNTGLGFAVALSGDGNTAMVGVPDVSLPGQTWVYMRTGTTWTRQATLVSATPGMGGALALSYDGNTAIIGNIRGITTGAWIYVRSGTTWTQQGPALSSPSNSILPPGSTVDISADGNTVVVSDEWNRATDSNPALRVYKRSGTTWSQYGLKLRIALLPGETGSTGTNPLVWLSVAVSGDGSTIAAGNQHHNIIKGAAAVFKLDANTPPTSVGRVASTSEDVSLVLSASQFYFSDLNPGQALDKVQITTLPAAGTLLLNGVPVALNQQISATSLSGLVFQPALNEYGSPYTSFRFHVSDGLDYSTSDYPMSIRVLPVNDAPALDSIGNITVPAGTTSYMVSLSGIGTGAANEVQQLAVMATCSNPGLISNPVIFYNNPSSTGTLQFNVVGGGGTATITITVIDDGGTANGGIDYFTRSFTVTVPPSSLQQTIRFENPGDQMLTNRLIGLRAQASSGLPVYFRVVSGPAIVVQDNFIQLLGIGLVTIEAEQPGNSIYAPAAPVTHTFLVQRTTDVLLWNAEKSTGKQAQHAAPEAGIRVFPNPATDVVTIDAVLEQAAPLSVTITDVTGRVVYRKQAGEAAVQHRTDVNLDQLKSGVYMIKLESEGQVTVRKFIRQ